MSFVAEHADAKALIAENGTAVTFSSTTATYSESDDTAGSTTSNTVAGSAIRTGNDQRQFQALGLIERDALTLLFAATTYGQAPSLGMSVTWGSVPYTVKAVGKVDPDGNGPIVSRVVVSR